MCAKRTPEPESEAEVVPGAKRTKEGFALSDVLNTNLLGAESVKKEAEKFKNSGPYTHSVFDPICNPSYLQKVRDELINNVTANFKETDLFKVFQTGDLAAADAEDPEHAEKLRHLMGLRDAIYSEAFRGFMEQVTGCGELRADKVDLSTNIYAHGGHLLCHDDVIGTRCVSFIIYLTEPEEEWTAADGGALELYPLKDGSLNTPSELPAVNHLPKWNTMAMFTVQPGRSFHAVQEVFAEEKPRLSISGWFHKHEPPAGADKATLSQLMAKSDLAAHLPPTGWKWGHEDEEESDLTAEDKALLRKWISPAYTAKKSLRPLMIQWEKSSTIQLQKFLREDIAEKIASATGAVDSAQGVGSGKVPPYDVGTGDGDDWVIEGPPHKQRFCSYAGAQAQGEGVDASPGALLAQLKSELLESHAFAKLMHLITDLGITGMRGAVRRFRPGLDYTVAHYGVVTKDPRLDVTLCFVADAEENDELCWASDEAGGFQCYIMADGEEAAASEVYRRDKEGEDDLISCSASSNTLNVVLRDEGLMSFVKYVSAAAPGSRWDVAMEYALDLDDDEIAGLDAAEDAVVAAAQAEAEASAAAAAGTSKEE